MMFILQIFFFLIHLHAQIVPRNTYIVHMDNSVMPKILQNHNQWYGLLINSLNPKSSDNNQEPPRLIYSYNHALHGFCARMSAYMDRNITLDTTHTFRYLNLNPSTGIWPATGYGKDVIIGLVDSGVWPESPSFLDDGMAEIPSRWKGICQAGPDFNSSVCNKKLIGVRYFSDGIMAANPNKMMKLDSGRDTVGHGTHTSSTAAGNYVKNASFYGYAPGTARGMAPRAHVAMYKAVWEDGNLASDILAGIDQAVADGVDIISISMGLIDTVPLYEDPIAIASFGAMDKGVLVSASAGNDKKFGTLHNGIPWILTVAAGSTDRFFGRTLTLGNGVTVTGWSLFPVDALVVQKPLVYNATVSSCSSLESMKAITGNSIVICEKGDVSSQMYFVSESNVAAGIFISNDTSIFESSSFPTMGVVISPDDAPGVIDYAKKGERPFASISVHQTWYGAKSAPYVASYSSRGPAPSFPGVLKPDVMAPGSLVLASYIPTVATASIGSKLDLTSEFALLSGTSMACPHVAGIAALLKGAHPEWSPAVIRSAMITTANPLDNAGNNIRDGFEEATPLAMGAGQVDPNRALDPGLVYDAAPQDYIDLLCAMNFTRSQIYTITRSIHRCPANGILPDLNYPSFIAFYTNQTIDTLVHKFKRTVTNVGSEATLYEVRVTAPIGSTVTVYPTKLMFRKKYEKKSYSVTVEYGNNYGAVKSGSITWIEAHGKHQVRSPIVISPRIQTL